jgi:7,8-dihydropterin-6-yl-methyl-4-(beta-D-ribofuranosyl)aminobenzene 5'-phosphate synthase
MHNAELLQISKASMSGAIHHAVQDVESVILSHGHFDHFGGLPIFLESSKKELLTIVHPGAFVERRRKLGPDQYSPMPILQEEMLVRAGADLDLRREASTVASNLILISGQVVRRTAFEKGSPTLEAKVNGRWAIDAFDDDQALAIDLKGKGLLIIGGCCHAGIINTINHICRVLGKKKVHAVFGGFHLSNAEQAAIVQTVERMQQINPELVVPMHCTGWQATHTFAATMPDQFIRNSVGTTYVLEGKQTPPLA